MGKEDLNLFKQFQKSPVFFIEKVWGITPQPLKEEKQKEAEEIFQSINLETYDPEWSKKFSVDWFEEFERGKHLTWQQWLILKGVEFALAGKAPRRITTASGHGIGKTAVLAWLNLWFLFCFKQAQIACTAPTGDQLYDVLWKEINVWLNKMPNELSSLYEWTTTYVRIKESPNTWFARAKTARKEAPEAIAGIHGEFVMIQADEASGIAEEIFKTGTGALSEKDTLVILISNPTRLIGYFYDTHNKFKHSWQVFQFCSLDSPIVYEKSDLIEQIKAKYGEDSDEYRIRVLGEFPKADAVDEKGYVPLLLEEDLRFTNDNVKLRTPYLGIDPSGEGSDTTAFVGRDNFRAKILASEKISNPMTIAEKATTLADLYGLDGDSIVVDNFGVGANVGMEMAHANLWVNAINVGEKAIDDSRYVNRRAEGYFMLRNWLRSGGELVRDERWKEL